VKNPGGEMCKPFKYDNIVNYRNHKDGIMSTFSPTGLLLFLIIIGLIGFLAFKVVKRLKKN
jgi:hypothetical protein